MTLCLTRFAEQASGMTAGKSCPCGGPRMPHAETTHTHTNSGNTHGRMFFDIGANLGLCSCAILASDQLASVTMFEPVLQNQAQIAQTICGNPDCASRAALFLGAVSSASGVSHIVGTFDSFGASRWGLQRHGQMIVPSLWVLARCKLSL